MVKVKHKYVSLEPYIYGKFQKFNNNAGWADENSPLMQTFFNWTADKSGYRYLICDLQGVQRGNEYLITDPCIHSKEDQSHGPTDQGVVGMENFFSGHKCNSLCEELGLPENPIPYNPSTNDSSTYIFQLPEEQKRQIKEEKGRFVNRMRRLPDKELGDVKDSRLDLLRVQNVSLIGVCVTGFHRSRPLLRPWLRFLSSRPRSTVTRLR